MAGNISDIIATGQNVVQAINNLRLQFLQFFPQISTLSSGARGSVGTITFTSSQATAFLAVTTSSGFVGWVPVYPSS